MLRGDGDASAAERPQSAIGYWQIKAGGVPDAVVGDIAVRGRTGIAICQFAGAAMKRLMSPSGYKETFGGPRCEVRSPLVSRHWRPEIRNSGIARLLTAQKRTKNARTADVWF